RADVRTPQPPSGGTTSRLWSDGFGRVATRSLQTLAALLVVAVLVFVVTQLTLVVIPVLIALVLAAAISPLVGALRRRGLPPLVATWLALLALVGVLAGVLWLVVRAVVDQWDELSDQAVDGFGALQDYVADLPLDIGDEQLDQARESLVDLLRSDAVG